MKTTEAYSHRYGPWALIAGGSEGIGYCFADRLAEAGINLILIARRIEPLAEARDTLLAKHPDVEIDIHPVDLTDSDLESRVSEIVGDREIGLLVYNAGATSDIDLFVDEPILKIKRLIDLNCHGPAVLCHALGQSMAARRRGGIIILSSMSGLAGTAYNVIYSSVKAFEMVLAEGLWAELRHRGVDVLCLVAGKTDTPSLARLTSSLDSKDDTESMSSAAVAEEGLRNIANGPVHIAGEGNREAAKFLATDRAQAIELLSDATAQMYSRPYPVVPT